MARKKTAEVDPLTLHDLLSAYPGGLRVLAESVGRTAPWMTALTQGRGKEFPLEHAIRITKLFRDASMAISVEQLRQAWLRAKEES